MSIEVLQAIPTFRIFDVAKAKEFYLGFLGFTLDWENRLEPDAPLYMQVSLGRLALHLSEHHGDGTPGSVVYARVRGLAEYHAAISVKGYRYLRPGLERRDGRLHVTLIDPFGNRLRLEEWPEG